MTTLPNRRVSEKVYAYITQGEQLLVFRHVDFPDAGIQVPGGTVNPGEPMRQAVLREAFEETGVANLEIVAELGETLYDMTPQGKTGDVHHRHYFHLRRTLPLPLPATWRHEERHAAGGGPPFLFEFSWVPVADAPGLLIAGMGELSHLLLSEAPPTA